MLDVVYRGVLTQSEKMFLQHFAVNYVLIKITGFFNEIRDQKKGHQNKGQMALEVIVTFASAA